MRNTGRLHVAALEIPHSQQLTGEATGPERNTVVFAMIMANSAQIL